MGVTWCIRGSLYGQFCVEKVLKKCSKSAHFYEFLLKTAPFLHIFTNFCKFLLIFYHFFLAYFAQTLQPNPLNPSFHQKTHITLEEKPQKN